MRRGSLRSLLQAASAVGLPGGLGIPIGPAGVPPKKLQALVTVTVKGGEFDGIQVQVAISDGNMPDYLTLRRKNAEGIVVLMQAYKYAGRTGPGRQHAYEYEPRATFAYVEGTDAQTRDRTGDSIPVESGTGEDREPVESDDSAGEPG